MNRIAASLLSALLVSACTLKRAEPEASAGEAPAMASERNHAETGYRDEDVSGRAAPVELHAPPAAQPPPQAPGKLGAAPKPGPITGNTSQPASRIPRSGLAKEKAASDAASGSAGYLAGGTGLAYELRDREAERCARCYPDAIQPSEPPPAPHSEEYAPIYENPFLEARANPLSTFSIDVDGASYSNTRRFLQEGQLPPADAVRIEEFVNYFDYEYPQPKGSDPFSITTEVASTPWNPATKLIRIGLQGRAFEASRLPPNNLVFLVDVSGSMGTPEKLPLLKDGFRMLVDQLRPQDRVSLVVYAGAAGMVLPPTPGSDKETLRAALDRLEAGGSTAGGAGLMLAYQAARDGFIRGGNNRVILATDGDFNVGISSDGELVRLIEQKRQSGVFLSVLGFGTGNYKDAKMEGLADKGNGNYFYIDNINEARKVLVEKLAGTLFAIAKDVKLQVEFNPAAVLSYRLVGYENRMLAAEDFNDDRKDAGELGAGSSVTALYEIVPAEPAPPKVDPLKYQDNGTVRRHWGWGRRGEAELLTVKFRYKQPAGSSTRLLSRTLKDNGTAWQDASEDFRFAAAAAGFGLLLRDSRYRGDLDFGQVAAMACGARGRDLQGRRAEFAGLVEQARALSGNGPLGYRGYRE